MERLKESGLKMTPQRLSILAYLEGNKSHPTAEDIYKHVSAQFPTMSFATVYNTIETLKRQGHVREITIEPGKRHFDPDMVPHHHLICTSCKRIVDVEAEFDLDLSTKDAQGFEITGSQVEFFGFCPECKAQKKEVNRRGDI